MEMFKQLGISEPILQVLKEKGFEKPSEIQEKSIPLVLEGRDVIAGASTGSGKTLAFGVRLIQNSKVGEGIQGLILTPTRELAEQISTALKSFAKNDKRHILAVYGGVGMSNQIDGLERAEIVVATPGRLLDHMQRGTIDLRTVKTLVLDEADRMMDMGFIDDVGKIISRCPKTRQTLLYSATISNEISNLARKWLNNPVEVSAEPNVDPEKLKQVFYDVEDHLKFSLLKHLLENEKSGLVMVFCNTRGNVDFIANNLKTMGLEVLPIHGGFSQDKRNRIMEQFHSKSTHVLVCTDVAARGLDIKGVTHVYNYDIPKDSKEYIHRIGRTARAGEDGIVINILASRDYDNFRKVLQMDNLNITKEETPQVERVTINWKADRGGSRGDSRGGSRGGRGYSRGNSGSRNYQGNRSNSSRDSGPRRSYGSREGNRSSRDSRTSHRTSNRNSYSRDSRRERRY